MNKPTELHGQEKRKCSFSWNDNRFTNKIRLCYYLRKDAISLCLLACHKDSSGIHAHNWFYVIENVFQNVEPVGQSR